MSTKTTTDSNNTLNYDSASKNIYSQLTGAGSNVLLDYIKNPLNNSSYNLGLGQSMRGATSLGNQNIQSMLNNMKLSGIGGGAGNAFQQAMMGNIGRGNQSLRSQANLGNVFQALNRQMTATGMGMSFSPLLTGESGHSTQQTGGLGTWLPQLLGTLGGAAMGAATGGMSGGMPFGSIGGKSNPALGSISGFGNMMQAPSMPGMPGVLPGGYQ